MKKILVAMSTYNGELFLADQIESIINQVGVDVFLKIRDDGSNDRTKKIIKEYAARYNNIKYEFGNNYGFSRSFFEAMFSDECKYDYYAFADQDDVWDADKLIRAVERLEGCDHNIKLYASGLKVVDENLNLMYLNEYPHLRISLGSALSRQRLAGCTMVFNQSLYDLCCKFPLKNSEMGKLISHDAVVYYTCLICGGSVIFEPKGGILYRRHNGTVTEHGTGFIKRANSVLNVFSEWRNKRQKQIVELNKVYRGYADKNTCTLLDEIITYNKSFKSKMDLFFSNKLNSGLLVVDIINKIAILFNCY